MDVAVKLNVTCLLMNMESNYGNDLFIECSCSGLDCFPEMCVCLISAVLFEPIRKACVFPPGWISLIGSR